MNEPIAAIRDALADTVHRLEQAGAKDELLAELTTRRLMLGLVRPPVLKPLGRVWRLGVLLLARNGTIYATGSVTRATETNRPTYQSLAAEERRSYRALAARSGLPMGETVNFNAEVITLEPSALSEANGPLFLRDGEPLVRWSHSLGNEVTLRLDNYLSDRLELLIHPPEGA